MYLRLNLREAKTLAALAKGEVEGVDARTVKRLKALGLLFQEFGDRKASPLTEDGHVWMRNHPIL